MKYYTSKTENKRFWIKRILILVLILSVTSVATVTVGLMLRSRSELMDKLAEETLPPLNNGEDYDQPLFNNDSGADSLSLKGDTLLLTEAMSADDAVRLVRQMAIGGYNAVSFTLSADDGGLLYRSAAANTISRIPVSGPTMDVIRTAVAQARVEGMRSSAIFTPGAFLGGDVYREESLIFDLAILSEIDAMGFDEVILSSLRWDTALDAEKAQTLISYISTARRAVPELDIGVSFAPAVYQDSLSLLQTDRLVLYADFLALDLRLGLKPVPPLDPSLPFPTAEETLIAYCEALSAPLTSYHLRVLIAPADGVETALAESVFENLGIRNFQHIR